MREHRTDHQHARGYAYDGGHSGGATAKARTPEEEAIARTFEVAQDAQSALTRAKKLAGVASRDTWRAEKATLAEKHTELTQAIADRAVDAAMSEKAKQHHDAAKKAHEDLGTVLAEAKEPRAVPPVAGEVEIEPGIANQSAHPDDIWAWAAGLAPGERAALARRLSALSSKSARELDTFAVALANLLADLPAPQPQTPGERLLGAFVRFLKTGRGFNRAAYEKSRAARLAAEAKTATDTAEADGQADAAVEPAAQAEPGGAATRAGAPTIDRPASESYSETRATIDDRSTATDGAAMSAPAGARPAARASSAPATMAADDREPASSVANSASPAATVQAQDASSPSPARSQAAGPACPASVDPAEWQRLLTYARNRSSDLASIIAQSAQLRDALDETMKAVESVAGDDYAYTLSFQLARYGLLYETSKERQQKADRDRHFADLEADRQIAEREKTPALAGQLACDLSEGVNKEQGRAAGAMALRYLQEIEAALLPAYRAAVDALDTGSVYAVAAVLLRGLRQADRARKDIEGALALPVASTPESTAEQMALLQDHLALGIRFQEVENLLARQLGPTTFRGQPVAGVDAVPLGRNAVSTLQNEASTVIALLASVDTIRGVAPDSRPGQSTPLSDEQKQTIAGEVKLWRGRPVNFAFLRAVLEGFGIWQEIAGWVAGDVAHVRDNEERFGVLADVGDYSHERAVELLSRTKFPGANGMNDTDARDGRAARAAFQMISTASPDARVQIVLELANTPRERGDGTCFDALMRYGGWQYASQLAELILESKSPEARKAFRMVQPHYLGKEDMTTIGDIVGDGWLAKGYNLLTGGAYADINAAQEAERDGWISHGEAMEAQFKAGARGVALSAAAGAFGELGGVVGGKLAARFGQDGLLALLGRGALEGAAAGVGGQFGADLVDQATGDKNGWSSVEQYGTAAAIGAGTGVLAAGLSVAAGRYLPPEQRTPPQQMAATFPEHLDVIEALAASPGRTVKIRIPRRRVVALNHDGILGGPIPAYVGGAPARGAVVADVVEDVVVIEVTVDAQLAAAGGPLGQYTLSSRLDDDGEMSFGGDPDVVDFIEANQPRRPRFDDDEDDILTTADDDARVSYPDDYRDLPEYDGYQVSDARNAGVVPDEGALPMDRHHVFPQSGMMIDGQLVGGRAWFKERGVDIDEFCVDLSDFDHDMIHGGNQGLASKHWREGEWRSAILDALYREERLLGPGEKLSRERILEIGREMMEAFEIADHPFIHYTRSPRP